MDKRYEFKPELTPVITEGADGRRWYTWTLKVSVSETWVEDGFEFGSDEEAHERFSSMLTHAHSHEYKVAVVGKPSDADVAKAQGFRTVREYLESNQ